MILKVKNFREISNNRRCVKTGQDIIRVKTWKTGGSTRRTLSETPDCLPGRVHRPKLTSSLFSQISFLRLLFGVLTVASFLTVLYVVVSFCSQARKP